MANETQPKNILILNNVRSAENVGACFRICDSCNCDLILQGITPHPIIKNDDRLPYIIKSDTKKISKTATESINNVNFSYYKEVAEVLEFINKNNYNLYSLEIGVKNSENLFEISKKIKKPFALVVGNEKEGIEKSFQKASCLCVYIPMHGKNISLNVSVASAVALYQLIH